MGFLREGVQLPKRGSLGGTCRVSSKGTLGKIRDPSVLPGSAGLKNPIFFFVGYPPVN